MKILNIKLLLFFLAISINSNSQVINDLFDKLNGANIYFDLNSENWISGSEFDITPNAGIEMFLSANGNSTGTFSNIGIEKTIGGIIENKKYKVSFFISKYSNLYGMDFSDFLEIKIGGQNGIIIWDTMPTPTIDGQWVKWTGRYTPAISDIGAPFIFKAKFDLDALHSIAIDGPIVVDSIPLVTEVANVNFDKINFQVYPNPTNNYFTIGIDNHKEKSYNLEILNTIGQVVLNKEIINSAEQVDLSGQPTGVYFVKLQSVNNTFIKKIIKQN
jgi:hypothetical protein